MHSPSTIIEAHGPLLILDAASSRIQVGLLGPGGHSRWAARTEEAGVGIFQCLEDLGVDIDAVGAFAFCDGPGSILGARSAAAVLRSWNVLRSRPTYAYNGLSLVAHALEDDALSVVADARRGLWHRYRLGGALERVPAEALTGPLVTPEGFRHWDPLPADTATTPYDLARLVASPAAARAAIFTLTDEPDAFLHQEPAYATWVPQIHRAP